MSSIKSQRLTKTERQGIKSARRDTKRFPEQGIVKGLNRAKMGQR